MLAWCFGDRMEWSLASAMAHGYSAHRPLDREEQLGLHRCAMRAAASFTTTRILDFHLRKAGIGERVMKDYRRFEARLRLLRSVSPEELAAKVF